MHLNNFASALGRLRWCPHKPFPKQAAFLSLTAREALYGGAAGGGKSDTLLMAALQYVDVPNYAALLLRRTFADLSKPGALMDRAHEWLGGTAAEWDAQQKRWLFPSGATLSFGYLEHANDHYQYQGAEYQFVGFDELTQFPEKQYRYLFSRLRRLAGYPVPIRMRAGSNPGGVGHHWVFQRFVQLGSTKDRVYLPATLDDNPFLDREEYESSLDELDEVERERLRRGNWYVRHEGLVFPDLEACFVDGTANAQGSQVGGIDFGFHNPFAALWGVLDHDDVLWIVGERYKTRTPISDHSACLPRGVRWYADPAGADQIAELVRADHDVTPCVHLGPKPLQVGIDRVNNRIRKGKLKCSPECRNLRMEGGLYQYDDKKLSEDPIDKDNHALSALRYLVVGIDRWRAIDYTPPDLTAKREEEARQAKELAHAAHMDIDNDLWWNG